MNRWSDLPGVQMFTLWLQSSTFICAGSSLVLASRARTSVRHAQAGAWPPSSALLGFLCTRYQAMPFAPFRRPSGIVAQGSERHGCRERRKGPWMALVRRPRSDDGTREVERSETRMQGRDFLVPFGGAGHPGDCQKELAQQGETNLPSTSQIVQKTQHPQPSPLPKRRISFFQSPEKKTHTPFGDVRQSVPLARYYLVCMIRSRRISVLIFTRWSSS